MFGGTFERERNPKDMHIHIFVSLSDLLAKNTRLSYNFFLPKTILEIISRLMNANMLPHFKQENVTK